VRPRIIARPKLFLSGPKLPLQLLRTDQILTAHLAGAGDLLNGLGGLLVPVALWRESNMALILTVARLDDA